MSFLAVELMLPANKQIFMYAAALLNADKLWMIFSYGIL